MLATQLPSSSPVLQWVHSGDAASPALIELLEIEFEAPSPIVDYIVQHISAAVEHGATANTRPVDIAKFTTFVSNVLTQSKATMPVILLTLVYIDRVRPRLQIICEQYAHERVFLGALMVARKFVCDCNYRCKHWSKFTNLFGPRDISRIEREFLQVLRFDLTFTESELLDHHDGIISSLSSSSSSRKSPLGISLPHHRHHHHSHHNDEACSHPSYLCHPHDSHFLPQRLTPESSHEGSPLGATTSCVPIAQSHASSPSSASSSSSSSTSPDSEDEDHSSPQTPITPPHIVSDHKDGEDSFSAHPSKPRTSFRSLFSSLGHYHHHA